ncbi:MAG: DNA/RNA nuclease SfsA [Deltaproteobacteria bacterium]|nr:DNA/RNA nuclease SfsA [Deltaproteobacteria bacterium]
MVQYTERLTTGKLIKRYKRFLADIHLDSGEEITAHLPNTGSMLSTKTPGSPVAVSYHPSPKRKLKWTLELVQSEGTWVGVNTSFSNHIVETSIAAGQIPELQGYDTIRREVTYGTGSRIDLLLESRNKRCYVEVKNVTYKKGAGAYFPDAVTTRGAKHLRELSDMVKEGHRAVMFFLVNRNDCQFVSPAVQIDPIYSETLLSASEFGVEIISWSVEHSLYGCKISRKVPVRLPI